MTKSPQSSSTKIRKLSPTAAALSHIQRAHSQANEYEGALILTEARPRWSSLQTAEGPPSNWDGRADPDDASDREPPAKKKNNPWPVRIFLISLVFPWDFHLGPMRLSAYRFVLLALLGSCLVLLIAGKVGKVRFADLAVLLFALWSALSLIVDNGFATAMQPAGIQVVETFGAYLLARCWIRDFDDLQKAVRLLFWIVVILMPFAVVECFGGGNVLRTAMGVIWPTAIFAPEHRLGLTRVMSVFEHPILFGLSTGSILALNYFVGDYNERLMKRYLKSAVILGTASLSLSTGPIFSTILQIILISWNTVLYRIRYRWKIFIAILILLLIPLELLANRSPLSIMTQMVVIDPQTYWYRRLIWDYGSATALNHPLFGIGLGDWERPAWMPNDTIDNFWLVEAIRYGLPAPILLLSAGISISLAMAGKRNFEKRLDDVRTGYIITMVFFFQIGWTVHFWSSTYVLALFLLGSGVWLLDAPPGGSEKTVAKAGPPGWRVPPP
ncbi:polymerase [Mesorhizobium sp. B2-6-2]|uniref:polymerase n=1 Tax=Mesorhizobium sp. B2-6-2 TaxID=2589915 RepID=UPI00112719F9|nr:polymerase [Mesorhizobium sp. B2-6-2]TPJ76776.1 polymerase [Mesorhizobium sp. B2-6-2]